MRILLNALIITATYLVALCLPVWIVAPAAVLLVCNAVRLARRDWAREY